MSSLFELPATYCGIIEERESLVGNHALIGVDEVGRGPLAGPVVAAAVALAPDVVLDGLNDSKKLSERQRERLFEQIHLATTIIGVGLCDPDEIDRLNILQASLCAMRRALSKLPDDYDAQLVLVDGKFCIPNFTRFRQKAIIKGDSLSRNIAAASIIAKVTRDQMMRDYDTLYPQYGFAKHKGYPTKVHKAAIANCGPSPIHRRSFKGVKEHLKFNG